MPQKELTSDAKPLGAQISHMLKERGVDVIFGIPGVHNQEMYRGIEEACIQHVLARHEQGAGFMADGYARATGKPGVAYVITGPGVCNIMTPMGQAYSDSVPLLVISVQALLSRANANWAVSAYPAGALLLALIMSKSKWLKGGLWVNAGLGAVLSLYRQTHHDDWHTMHFRYDVSPVAFLRQSSRYAHDHVAHLHNLRYA